MTIQTRLCSLLLAGALTAFAGPAGAREDTIDLHAEMVSKLAGSCRLDSARLAQFQPRMIVVHAVIDQTSLPAGWARAKVLKPLLGGIKAGALLPMSHFRQTAGGSHGAHFVEGKEYLISMYRSQNVYVVDRALECQSQS